MIKKSITSQEYKTGITNAQEGEDLKPKNRQLKLHHLHQLADAGEEQNCFSPHHTTSLMLRALINNSLWQGPDNDKLHSVEAGGGSEGDKSKSEKEVGAGHRGGSLPPVLPIGHRPRRLTPSHNSPLVGFTVQDPSETMRIFRNLRLANPL